MLEKLLGKGQTKAPNLLVQAREKVAGLEVQTREALRKKKELEAQAKVIRAEADRNRMVILVPQTGLRFGSLVNNQVTPLPEAPSEEVITWLHRNAPDQLPRPTAPIITVEQQAILAHGDYIDLCNRLLTAKQDLTRLQRRVNEVRDLIRCIEEDE